MMVCYAARYSDRLGTESTAITNDGRTLSLVVRGVTFAGPDFDTLEPTADTDPARLDGFTVHQGSLCACVLEVEFPVPVATPGGMEPGLLLARLELGDPAPNGGLDREHLLLELPFGGQVFRSRGGSGWFEDEMLDIQKQLPVGTHLQACITCAYSDYSPLGHGLFGGLACFRTCKTEYLGVQTKADIFRIWGKRAGFVQETYLCPEFERRQPGTGYRG